MIAPINMPIKMCCQGFIKISLIVIGFAKIINVIDYHLIICII
jgi:hypothetical protein